MARLHYLLRRINWRRLVREPKAESGRILSAVLHRAQVLVRRRKVQRLPDWIQQEITAMSVIEPELLGHLGQSDGFYEAPMQVHTWLGKAYVRLVDAVGSGPVSHVLLLPWLVRGGADRGALYHLQAWLERAPANQLLVVLTENVPSPWRERIPPGVRVLDFGLLTRSLQHTEQVALLTRLLVQMAPAVIHNINCHVGWEAFRRHGLALRQVSHLYASLFCDDHSPDGVPVGYARSYLRSCAQHMSALFCDNAVFPRRWADELGIGAEQFTVVRFPWPAGLSLRRDVLATDCPLRVLWAGRFCAQKRLDLLLQVASVMPDVTFDVHGTGADAETAPYLRKLKALSNVRVMGAFENFSDIVRNDHAAYLFTSSWEGMPTILMDACAAGLPIVASDVGAVSDLLPASSLVADVNDPQSYCMALRQVMSDPVLWQERRLQQYAALASGRSWSDFTDTLARIDCYLPTPMTAQTSVSTGTST